GESVYYDQGGVPARCHGDIPTDDDVRTASRPCVRQVHLYPCGPTAEHFRNVGGRNVGGFLHLNGGHGTDHITFSLGTVAHNNDFVQGLEILYHYHMNDLLVTHLDFLCYKSDITQHQDIAIGNPIKVEFSIKIAHHTLGRSLNQDIDPGYGSCVVGYRSTYGSGL